MIYSIKKVLLTECFLNFTRHKLLCQQRPFISYKDSLLLPQTKFPHKVNTKNRQARDHSIEVDAKFEQLYKKQKTKQECKKFILHDGPPYANGNVHIGHSVNKILKDITVRSELLKNKIIFFTPGWDCHGLPIELKVLKENYKSDANISEINIRQKAYSFSQKIIEKQKVSFMQWGILADWSNSYITCKPHYIIQQLNVFQDLYEKEIIFQDHKPVFWSPDNRTSLAEAELEYNPSHISPSLFVKFSVKKCPDVIKVHLSPGSILSALIWTTTPWTLPANQAVCYAPNQRYCVAFSNSKKEYYLIAQPMLSFLENKLKSELRVTAAFEGSVLSEFTYSHPIAKDRECPFLPSTHVTMDKGTGLVHTAPNHGLDDYVVIKKQNISLDPCLVDENGCYNIQAIKELQGKDVLKEGTKFILDFLSADIVQLEDYVHSYPYDWRSKTPVIIRSSRQWFIDVNLIREQAIECLKDVTIVPEHFKKVFLHQLESAPQWCISRQRAWGVPIPAFYSSDRNKPLVHRAITNHLCSLIQAHGIHCWWERPVNELLPPEIRNELDLPLKEYQKGSDIMDIWFDSGISWKCVLPEPHISDICIEGIDQIRGWFNSSLLTSVALRGKAPYKTFVLHGFTTDSEGRKMSKSEGNVISPEDIISGSKKIGNSPYGIDVLRWWVASHACQSENIPVKMEIFDECAQNLNKLRNTFKFLLGNLNEYFPNVHETSPLEMRDLDVYMLHILRNFYRKVLKQYNLIQYKGVSKDVLNFVTNEVSSFYCHLVKDRLYCEAPNSKDRLDCQLVLQFILNTLLQSVGPICPHLAEEVYLFAPYKKDSISLFENQFSPLDEFLNATSVPLSITLGNQIRGAILKAGTKTTLDMEATVSCSPKISEILQNMNKNSGQNTGMKEFFQVADIRFTERHENSSQGLSIKGNLELIEKGETEAFSMWLTKTTLEKCPRCRLFASSSKDMLCNRCSKILNAFFLQSYV